MHRVLAGAIVAALLAFPALAKAPEPRKTLDLSRFMGRWYEIVRTPNLMQRNCYAASQVWSRRPDGKFAIAQVCHRDSADGPEKTVMTTVKVLDPDGASAKLEASFFGGLVKQQYWILDRADDYSWMIASTEGGHYVSVLARAPALPRAEIDALVRRIAAMGLDTGKLAVMAAK
jgi:apolipoprotein D and lipocalin family protein